MGIEVGTEEDDIICKVERASRDAVPAAELIPFMPSPGNHRLCHPFPPVITLSYYSHPTSLAR